MNEVIVAKILAGAGALLVGFFALKALREEWHKTALEDQVTKIMMVLLTLGCVLVLSVAFGIAGRV
jgi:hypothetical protein